MLFSNVYIDTISYELAPHVITTAELEERLVPFYKKINFNIGQIESLTGIIERRFWDRSHTMHENAAKAGKKALEQSGISPSDIGMVVYGGVCRDQLEPSTACAVAEALDINQNAEVFDVSNACLGVLTGMVRIASAIELGIIKSGIVVSCESSRQIVDLTIKRILDMGTPEMFRSNIATLTGGSGAVAVILTDKSLKSTGHKLKGYAVKNAARHNGLCKWGPDTGIPCCGENIIETDSIGVMKHGVELAIETYKNFKTDLQISGDTIDKVICHQVGAAHQKSVLKALNIKDEIGFTTFQYLGNMGSVSLPLTAAMADENGFISKGDFTGFFGIGSGLNCMMMGVDW